MLQKLFLLFIVAASLFNQGCSGGVSQQQQLGIYAPVDQELAEAVGEAFRQAHPEIKLQLYYKPQQELEADLLLGAEELLRSYQQEDKLQPQKPHQELASLWGDSRGYWQNFFYDPVVLLINQHFARQVGQHHVRSWADVAGLDRGRIVFENLTNSSSTRNFLGSLASQQGEEKTMALLSRLDQRVVQYVKLPFTPVRMVAVGDADIALTRQSYVAQYLESCFPAYMVLPREGTPVNLYGLAILSHCQNPVAAKVFLNWLRQDALQAMVAQEQETGYGFLLNLESAAAQQLWQNSEYLSLEQEKILSDQWLQSVRFGVRS